MTAGAELPQEAGLVGGDFARIVGAAMAGLISSDETEGGLVATQGRVRPKALRPPPLNCPKWIDLEAMFVET